MSTLDKIAERLSALTKKDTKIGPNNRTLQRVEQDSTGKITLSFKEFEVFILEFGDQLEMHLPIMYDVDAKPIDDAQEVASGLLEVLQKELAGREFEVVLIEE